MLSVTKCRGPFQPSLIEEEAQQHCNCRFSKRRHFGAVLQAEEDIVLGPEPVELLVNYGIANYWLDFFARPCRDPGMENPMIRTVLWCATSTRAAGHYIYGNWSLTVCHQTSLPPQTSPSPPLNPLTTIDHFSRRKNACRE